MRTQAVSHQETGLFVEIAATSAAFSTTHLLGRSQQHFPDIVQLDGQLTACGSLLVYKARIIKNTSGFQHIEDSSAYLCANTEAPYLWLCSPVQDLSIEGRVFTES